MLSPSRLRDSRAVRFAAALLAVAVVAFGGGVLTARALSDDSDEPAAAGPAAQLPGGQGTTAGLLPPGDGARSGAVSPRPPQPLGWGGSSGAATADDKLGEEDRSAPWYGCRAALPAIAAGTAFDLSRASFDLRLLGEGYVLLSVNVYAEGECEDGQDAGEGTLVVETAWRQEDSSSEVYITQRVSPEPQANYVSANGGQVWSDGYLFSAWMNSFVVYAEADGVTPGAAVDTVRAPDAQDNSADLRAILRRLAPSVGEACFYEQFQGSWGDLSELGIGDPRPAIPAGLFEQYAEFTVFRAPPDDCNVPALAVPASFSASWGAEGRDGKGEWIYVSAGAIGPGETPGAGYVDEGSAYWSDGRYYYSVSAYGEEGPIGRSTIEAIARALDSEFASACFVQSRALTEGDLESLGLPSPDAPTGWKVARSSLQITELPGADCEEIPDAGYYPQVNLYWTIEGDGGTIDVSVNRYGDGTTPGFEGYIYEGGLSWTSADGLQFSVNGWKEDGSGVVGRETLISVALSLDPTLDVDTLSEGPVEGPIAVPRDGPLPVTDAAE